MYVVLSQKPTQVLLNLSTAVSVVLWFCFPDSPVDARFLTEEEKILAVKRVAEGKLGVKNKTFKSYQVRIHPLAFIGRLTHSLTTGL